MKEEMRLKKIRWRWEQLLPNLNAFINLLKLCLDSDSFPEA